MMLTGFLGLARCAGVTSCLREGISWILCDGTQAQDNPPFVPAVKCDMSGCDLIGCVKGFLVLIPFRKNKQAAPTWIQIAEKNAIAIVSAHLQFLRRLRPSSPYMFLSREEPIQVNGSLVFQPCTHKESFMSTNDFRDLVRLALRECCGLSADQAKRYGTHSLKIGAIELLRSRGLGRSCVNSSGAGCRALLHYGTSNLPQEYNLMF